MKIRSLAILAFLICISIFLQAQESDQLIPYRKGKKWGYANISGKLVIPPIYHRTEVFIGSLAVVRKGKKHGIINRANEVLIPFRYEAYIEPDCVSYTQKEIEHLKKKAVGIKQINQNFSSVFISSYGNENEILLIDNTGQFIYTPSFTKLQSVKNPYYKSKHVKLPDLYIAHQDKKAGLVNNQGFVISSVNYDKIFYNNNGTFTAVRDSLLGLLDTLGNELTPFVYSDFMFYFGLGQNKMLAVKDGLQGVLNKNGKTVFPFKYKNLSRFYGSYASAKIGDKYVLLDSLANVVSLIESSTLFNMNGHGFILSRDGQFGVVNWEGKTIMPFIYDRLEPFDKQFIKATKNGKIGLLDYQNKVVVPIKYDRIYSAFQHHMIVAKKDNKEGLISYNNEIILPLDYDKISFSKDIIIFSKGDISGFFFPKSGIKTNLKYSSNYTNDTTRYLRVSQSPVAKTGRGLSYDNLLHGLIDKQTGEEIIPCMYQYLDFGNYDKGILLVKSNGKYGAINISKKVLIPFEYQHLIYSPEDFIIASDFGQQEKASYFDLSGEAVFKTTFEQAKRFSEGRAAVKLNGKWGYIDNKGKIVVPCKYQSVRPFQNDVAWVVEDIKQFGYVGKNGLEFFE